MITTITLNPSVDIRYFVKDFAKGGIFRTAEHEKTAGGKGLNVSKTIIKLGEQVNALGFLGGENGKYIEKELELIGIENYFTEIQQNTRNCIAILSNDNSQTEILESGPEIAKREQEDFYKKYTHILKRTNIICASGSLPKNVNQAIYGELIRIAKEENKRFILDTSGEPLLLGLQAAPYLIKPNLQELEFIIGQKINTEKDFKTALIKVKEFGVNIIIVSLGKEGAFATYQDKLYKITIPQVSVLNPVGSGDCMVGGLASALDKEYDFEKILLLGTACGISNAMERETGSINLNVIKKIMKEIKIKEMSF